MSGLFDYIDSANEKVVVAIYATLYKTEGTTASFETELAHVCDAFSRLSSNEQNEVESFLKQLNKDMTNVFLCREEVESTAQPQTSQDWPDRVRAVRKLTRKEAEPAYVALIGDALGIGSDKVHVAKSEKDYRPGVINFDWGLKEVAVTIIGILPITRSDPLPGEPMVVLGPKALSESSPILTQATERHERTHESHGVLIFNLTRKWKRSKYDSFVKWPYDNRRKEAISEEHYHLIMDQYQKLKKFTHTGISEILSNLAEFTAYYHSLSEEEVKMSFLSRNLSGMSADLGRLRGKAERAYLDPVCDDLLRYYGKLDKGHRRTFDFVLDKLLEVSHVERQKTVYKRWTRFRLESP